MESEIAPYFSCVLDLNIFDAFALPPSRTYSYTCAFMRLQSQDQTKPNMEENGQQQSHTALGCIGFPKARAIPEVRRQFAASVLEVDGDVVIIHARRVGV